jgi:hypothetical protein
MRRLCEFMGPLYTNPQAFRAKFISYLPDSFIHIVSEYCFPSATGLESNPTLWSL